jgi:hypothetical protein
VIDWKLYKGEGPWIFAPQQNKWGYLNNPRWAEPPREFIVGGQDDYDGREGEEPQIWDMEGRPKVGRTDAGVTHDPCGHWHKPVPAPVPVLDVNLFRVTDPWLSYGSIQSIFFNHITKRLSLVNYYVSSPGVCAIEILDNQYIATIEGRYDTAKLVILDRYLNVVQKYSIFNYYDCTGPRSYHLNYHDGYIYWSSVDSGQPSVIGRLTYPGFVRDSRFSPGGVFVGSDGNFWQYDATYSSMWSNAIAYPITGDPLYYNSFNDQIMDNDHSGPVYTWGDGTQGAAVGSSQSLCVKDGVIYFTASASPNAKAYAYDANNFSLIGRVTPSSEYGRTIFKSANGYVYTAGGSFNNFRVNRYDSELNHINNAAFSGYGRVIYTYSICDLGDYIVVGTDEYTGDSGLYLLNSDMSLVYLYVLPNSIFTGAQCVISSGNFLFVGENNHVSVFELVGSELVFLDRIYVDFSPTDVGFVSKWLKLMTV